MLLGITMAWHAVLLLVDLHRWAYGPLSGQCHPCRLCHSARTTAVPQQLACVGDQNARTFRRAGLYGVNEVEDAPGRNALVADGAPGEDPEVLP